MNKNNEFHLRENEKIIEEVYHHLVIVVPHLIVALLIIILNFFLMYFLFLQGWWGVALFVAVILLVVFYVLRLFFLYRKNKFLITNKRIVDFEQPGFFEKFINEFPFPKIVEVKAIVKGVWPTIFRYGNLKLMLAEDLGPFELYKISNPAKLQYLINEMLQSNEASEAAKASKCVDSISMVMAEISLLTTNEKEEIIRRIEQQLLDGRGKVGAE